MQTGATIRVSVGTDGSLSNGQSDEAPSISADGRYVAFASTATNLAPGGDTIGAFDVFVRDLQTSTTSQVSTTASGTGGNSDSRSPSISADGRFVAFHSFATNFDSVIAVQDFHIFTKDRQTGGITREDISTNGKPGNGGAARASISADGRFVSFDSVATNLVKKDTNGVLDVFIRQRF